MTLRQTIPSDYLWANGQTMPLPQLQAYNQIQLTINRYISEGRNPPDSLLNYSHKIVREFLETRG